MILQLENISKYYGSDLVFKGVDLKIEEGNRIGLIGVNGAGKTTLLGIISGENDFEEGARSLSAGRTIGFLKQSGGLGENNTIYGEMLSVFEEAAEAEREIASLHPQLANSEEGSESYGEISEKIHLLQKIIDAKDGYNADVKIKTVLNGMGFKDRDPQTPVSVLSGGEKTRLALCKQLLERPDLLILDEPTNHLDFKTLEWLENYLGSYPGAIVVVSHDRYFLNRLVTAVGEIEHGVFTLYPGNYDNFIRLKDENYMRRLKVYEAQQREIAKLEDFVRKNLVRASTSKRAKSKQKAIDRMDKEEKPSAPPKKAFMHFRYDSEPVKDVLDVAGLTVSVGEPETVLFENFDLHMFAGDKIAFIGENGVGKTTLFKMLTGEKKPSKGKIEWGRGTKSSYYTQDTSGLDTSQTVLGEIHNRYPAKTELELRTLLGGLLFTGEDVVKSVATLSGGEKARLKLADLSLRKSNVLLLDEPTNHLDTHTKQALDKALAEYTGTLLIISHDRYMLSRVPDKIAEVTPDGVRVYKGNYEDYTAAVSSPRSVHESAKTTASEQAEQSEKKSENSEGFYRGKKERARLVQNAARLKQLEKDIELLETEIRELGDRTADAADDYKLLLEIGEELAEKNDLLEQKTKEWLNFED